MSFGILLFCAQAHAQQALGEPGPNQDAQPFVTLSAGPLLSVPAGDYGFTNGAGFGGFVTATVRIGAQFSFAARLSSAESPKLAAFGAVNRHSNTVDAGINYFIATPHAVRVVVAALAGKHSSVPEFDNIETDSGFGLHAELGLHYFPHSILGLIAVVGYSYAWTTKLQSGADGPSPIPGARIDIGFEMLSLSAGIEARW
ncbi:MAG: outer membrane beta-barrel protein [Kofleriaceae bacterium]|nr:outer membrane beta-barrel protein [Kofleriaceae bacterium]